MSPRTTSLRTAALSTALLPLAALTALAALAAACGPAVPSASDVPVVVVPANQPDPSAAASSSPVDAAARIDKRFVGVWIDLETRARHTIEERGGTLVVSSVIDDDGESYEVRSSKWDGSTLRWSYFVGSTEVLVTLRSKSLRGDSLTAAWANDTDHGTQEFERAPSDDE